MQCVKNVLHSKRESKLVFHARFWVPSYFKVRFSNTEDTRQVRGFYLACGLSKSALVFGQSIALTNRSEGRAQGER